MTSADALKAPARVILGASVLLLFSLTDVAAQRALFTVLTPEQTGGLTSAQTNRLRSVEASRNAGDVKVVRMGLTALRDDTLRLTLSGRSVPAMRQKTLVRSPSDFTWVGQLPTGAAILVVRNGQVTGSIQNGTEIYEITPLGGGAHAIVEVDHTGFPYTVTLSGKPGAGGALDGAGSFPAGALHTVTAAPNGGYTFVSWTEGKKVVSDQPSFSFKVTGNRKLVANFLRSGGGGQEDGGLAIQQHWLSARQTRSRWTTPLGRLSKKQQGGDCSPPCCSTAQPGQPGDHDFAQSSASACVREVEGALIRPPRLMNMSIVSCSGTA